MKKNRLLAIPGAFVPTNDTVTLITYKHLRQQDYDIKVMALEATSDQSLKKQLSSDHYFNKFNIEYIAKYDETIATFEKKNIIQGIINMFRYVKACIKEANSNEYQVVYTSSIPAFTHVAGYFIKRKFKTKIKWVASFSDPLLKSPYKYDKESFREYSLLAKIGFIGYITIYMSGMYEKIAMKNADEIIYISEQQKEFMISNYSLRHREMLEQKSTIIPLNYIPEWKLYDDMINSTKTEANHPLVVAHFGRVYGLRQIGDLLLALYELKTEYPRLEDYIVFHQYGELIKRYQKMIQDYQLESVFVYHDKIPYEEVTQKMIECDVLALFDTITKGKQPYLPSKTLECILMKKEIFAISPSNCPAAELLSSLGYTCTEYSVFDIKERIKDLIKNELKTYDYELSAFENKKYHF